jgi:hypothetical protein
MYIRYLSYMHFLSSYIFQSFIYFTLYYREINNHIPEEKRVLLVIRIVRDLATVEAKIIARSINGLVIFYFNR